MPWPGLTICIVPFMSLAQGPEFPRSPGPAMQQTLRGNGWVPFARIGCCREAQHKHHHPASARMEQVSQAAAGRRLFSTHTHPLSRRSWEPGASAVCAVLAGLQGLRTPAQGETRPAANATTRPAQSHPRRVYC
ncbi:hypothetical protein B0T11DRAFT_277222 [Plectosphaerella cucumerina]|uniref:Secreted protein n=1 Tax=Plectosphaerella cucumerina TaxID=40658 RepID=A0A8K0X821_9PEZI|nr:hypothetical protein B0T11DRAFT_277222 [Plectosphaerella cucumerina]